MLKTSMLGRVGADAEARQVGEQWAISFSVAHSESWRDKGGDKVEVTYWIKCTKWMKTDKLAQYIKRGDLIYVEGLPKAEAWADKAGNLKSQVVMNVRDLELQSNGAPGNMAAPANPADNPTGSKEEDLPF